MPDSLKFKQGLYKNISNLSNGDVGFAQFDANKTEGTLVLKSNNKIFNLMPAPGVANKPLIGQGDNVAPKYDTLSVAGGGTGRATLSSGFALIGNGTEKVALRQIRNNTSATYITPNTYLITANTLAYWNGAYNSSGTSRITRVGTVSKGTWNATPIAIKYGGTGATTAPEARANLGAASITFITWGKDDTYATIDG